MILSEITSKAISMQWKCTQHQTEMLWPLKYVDHTVYTLHVSLLCLAPRRH